MSASSAVELPLDDAAFRRALGLFATGVAVVTTCCEGVDHAMTANSFTSVSLDPLLVLVCVEDDSRFHEAVACTPTWAVSVLDAGARRHAAWFARRGRPLHGQFAQVPHRRGRGGSLLLDDAVAWVEARTVAVHRAGDHDIVVGEVAHLSVADPPREPLLYWASAFRALAPERPAGGALLAGGVAGGAGPAGGGRP